MSTTTTDNAALSAALSTLAARPSNRKLVDYLNRAVADHHDASASPTSYRQFVIRFYNSRDSLTRIGDAALSPQEYDQLDAGIQAWLTSLAPIKQRGTPATFDANGAVIAPATPDEYYPLPYSATIDQSMADWRALVESNKRVEDALATIDITPDPAIDRARALHLAWTMLYATPPRSKEVNVRALFTWLRQTVRNLGGTHPEHHHRHILLYVSRDKTDGSARGGNGKTFVGKAIRAVFEERGLPVGGANFPSDRSQFVSQAFATHIFLQLNELPSPTKLNLTALKEILEDGLYKSQEKHKEEVEVPSRAILVGSSNMQGWFSPPDDALKQRLNLIDINADLDLREDDPDNVLDAVNAAYPLPTKEEIAAAFLQLLKTPEKVMTGIINEFGAASHDATTDLSSYEVGKVIRDICHDPDPVQESRNFTKNAPPLTTDGVWVSPAQIFDKISEGNASGKSKYHINPNVADEVLRNHFGRAKSYRTGAGRDRYTYLNVEELYRFYTSRNSTILESIVDPPSPVEAYRAIVDFLRPGARTPDTDTPPPPSTSPDTPASTLPDTPADADADIIVGTGPVPESNIVFRRSDEALSWFHPADIVTDPNHDALHLTEAEAQFEGLNPVDIGKGQAAINAKALASGYGNATVATRRNFVFELDDEALEAQQARARKLADEGIINRAVFSGGKSIHCRVTIAHEPVDDEEYKVIWGMLNDRYFDGKADRACSNPARKTRHPGGVRDNGNEQTLLYGPTDAMIDVRPALAKTQASRQLAAAFTKGRRAVMSRNFAVGDGRAANSAAVRAYMDADFSDATSGHGDDAHNGLYRALVAAIGAEDDTTLAAVVAKARAERWTQTEIDGDIKNARKYLAEKPA